MVRPVLNPNRAHKTTATAAASKIPTSSTAEVSSAQAATGADSTNVSPVEKLSFEDALEELENVVSKLETGRVPLEESLALLRSGTALIERCERELNSAEAALEQLIATPDGELQTVPIGVEDD